ncbi:MAG: hypothetical protein HY321_08720 [Armatimonadetes bacterium]|nr:hypothetical protein [Armatimonadota bacterium]
MKTRPFWTRLTTGHLLALFPVGLLCVAALAPVDETDLWWHLKAGEWMLDHRAIPRTGLWSWVGETRPWVTHEWLFEVGAAALYRLAGAGGLILAKVLLVALTFALVQRHARLRSGSAAVAAVVTVAAGIASWPFWSERPQLITYALAAWFLLTLDRWQRGERAHVWVLAPAVMVWGNLHGGYMLAFLLFAVYFLGEAGAQAWGRWRGEGARWEKLRHLGVVGAASAALAVINPHGPEILAYPFRYVGSSWLTRFVSEWQSPNFREVHFQIVAAFLLGTVAVLAASPLRPRASQVLLALLLTFMGLHSLRNLPLMILGLAPLLSEHLRALADHAAAARAVPAPPAADSGHLWPANWAILAMLPLLIAVQAQRCRRESVRTTNLPAEAVRYLEEHPLPGRMLNHYDWGGYLIWKLAPRTQVFIDGRLDIYGPKVADDYGKMHFIQPEWRRVLDRYRFDWVIWRRDGALAQILAVSPDWERIYRDPRAVIFVRRGGQGVPASDAAPDGRSR